MTRCHFHLSFKHRSSLIVSGLLTTRRSFEPVWQPNTIRTMIDKIRSGGCDYESGNGFHCFLIVLMNSIFYSLRNTYQPILVRSLGRLICRFLCPSLRRWGCGMKKHPQTGSRRRGFFPRAWVMAIRLKNNFFPRRWSRREGEFLCTGIIAKRFKDKFFREKDCRQGGGFPRAWALGKT
jgi:hypothetical protein